MTTRTIAVVSAGLRQPSSSRLLADRLAQAVRHALDERGVDVELEVVELRDHAHDLTNHLLTGFPSQRLRAVLEAVADADGLIAVTPIFSASYTGLFKSFFDVLEEGTLTGAPTLIAATGGTARHSLALEHAVRPLLAYLRALVVPTAVFAAPEDWGAGDEAHRGLTERIGRAASELATLVASHQPRARPDPFAEPVPFEELLRASSR